VIAVRRAWHGAQASTLASVVSRRAGFIACCEPGPWQAWQPTVTSANVVAKRSVAAS
jgi:hypothetical protein